MDEENIKQEKINKHFWWKYNINNMFKFKAFLCILLLKISHVVNVSILGKFSPQNESTTRQSHFERQYEAYAPADSKQKTSHASESVQDLMRI